MSKESSNGLTHEGKHVQARQQIQEAQSFLQREYGLYVQYSPSTLPEIGVNKINPELTLNQQARILRVIQTEIQKYPPEFIKSLNMPGIVFGLFPVRGIDKSLLGGEAYPGHPLHLHSAAITPIKRTFHHELAHYAWFKRQEGTPLEKEWKELNKKGKLWYLQPLPSLPYMVATVMKGHLHPGVTRRYGLTNIEEDFATVAELLMTDPEKAQALAQKDEVLAAKMDLVRKVYTTLSNGRMNSAYFNDLQAGNIQPGYWS